MKNKTLFWESKRLNRAFRASVPPGSGVYVIVAVRRVLDFPAQLDLLYVGKSKNLRRRFIEHSDPWSEHNLGLKQVAFDVPLEFWHASVSEDALDSVERELIQQANPSANVVTYWREK